MMKKLTDPFILHNGVSIPCIGYGTFNTSNEDAAQAVREALAAGYRHIDTAATYGNEVGVGEGIRTGGVPREEIFVTSKVWNTERGYDKTRTAFEKTLQDLGLDYLDLYLLHWRGSVPLEETAECMEPSMPRHGGRWRTCTGRARCAPSA